MLQGWHNHSASSNISNGMDFVQCLDTALVVSGIGSVKSWEPAFLSAWHSAGRFPKLAVLPPLCSTGGSFLTVMFCPIFHSTFLQTVD